MTITHFLYNSFVISTHDLRVAIDPGGELFHLQFKPIIPPDAWKAITHVLVTHADPDHHWHTDRVVERSDATVICSNTLTRVVDGKRFVLGPRSRGLSFDYRPPKVQTVGVGESVFIDGMTVRGVAAEHGPLTFRFGPIRKTFRPGPSERIGYGAIGFMIELEDKVLVNLGDTLKLLDQWTDITGPDVLMIPIGGDEVGNTMGIDDALETIKRMQPRIVIPCHHNLPTILKRNGNPTDVDRFAVAVRSDGIECAVLKRGESLVI